MPRRKQDKPKRMKWEEGGDLPGSKDDEMECGVQRSEDEDAASSPPPSSVKSSATPPLSESQKSDEEGLTAAESKGDVRRMVTAEGEIDEPVLAAPTTPPPPLPPPATPPMIFQKTVAEELILQRTLERQTPSPVPNSISPKAMSPHPCGTPPTTEEVPLDFSMKKGSSKASSSSRDVSPGLQSPGPATEGGDSPLDLSVPRRSSGSGESHSRQGKLAKLESSLAQQVGALSPWGYAVPKSLPGKMESPAWNGCSKGKSHRSSKSSPSSLPYSGKANSTSPLVQMANVVGLQGGENSKPGRQNPWQTQWMSKSGEQAKDVFTCVWCKESFRSLAEMTVHMKQSPRCGMAGMQASIPSCTPSPPSSSASHQGSSPGSSSIAGSSGTSSSKPQVSTAASGSSSAATSSSNLLQGVKDSMPLPRKLVRGQDVWLGKGAEQTRQILKCMWCGQSFKTLADMTTHMRVTQHYTNIISQEQIISWRTPEDKVAAQSQVNAVLTCKVCDQAFGSLKELSYHMVKNSHYKEHILRSISEGGGRRRQTRERRKKSLPVRKLLELERMEINKQGVSGSDAASSGHRGVSAGSSAAALAAIKNEQPAIDGKITCEECAEKVDAKDFVRHIKKCSGQRNHSAVAAKIKTEPMDDSAPPSRPSPALPSPKDGLVVPSPSEDSKTEKGAENSCDSAESTSVLNAIERLIEKSFEHKGRRGAPTAGILQRLGIDEEVYPPWHPASSPGKITSGSESGRAKSTSPMRFDPTDPMSLRAAFEERKLHAGHPGMPHHGSYDGFNHAGSETSRGSTPVSLMNTSSPARSLTTSPHRTHSSMTGSTCGSPPPSPQSLAPASPAPSHSSIPRKADSVSACQREDEPPCRSPKESPRVPDRPMDQDTDLEDAASRSASPAAALAKPAGDVPSPNKHSTGSSQDLVPPKLVPERPSRSSSVSSFEEAPRIRTPASDSDASLRPASSAEEQPLELTKPVTGASKRKKGSRHHHQHHRKNEQNKKSKCANSEQLGADHPLRELQKLLDKTDAHLSRPPAALQPANAGPGSILAFSWACNDVAASSDSMMKCAFCETHFISKGAYRHHLSKMHFVKDGAASTAAGLVESPPPQSSNHDRAKNGTEDRKDPNASQPLPSSVADESTHSKFLKYTELAKQLSSKYV